MFLFNLSEEGNREKNQSWCAFSFDLTLPALYHHKRDLQLCFATCGQQIFYVRRHNTRLLSLCQCISNHTHLLTHPVNDVLRHFTTRHLLRKDNILHLIVLSHNAPKLEKIAMFSEELYIHFTLRFLILKDIRLPYKAYGGL